MPTIEGNPSARPPSANDNFANATVIRLAMAGNDYISDVIDVAGNTVETGEAPFIAVWDHSAWWKYAPGADGVVKLEVRLGHPFYSATRLNIWPFPNDALPVDFADFLARCDDYDGPSLNVASKTPRYPSEEKLEFAAAQGYTYYITVQTAYGSVGGSADGTPYEDDPNYEDARDDDAELPIQFFLNGPASIDYAPTVILHPFSKSVHVGDTVAMTSLAYGVPTPTLQWERRHGPAFIGPNPWVAISGATSSPYWFVASIDHNAMEYRAVWTSALGVAYSDPATLTVLTAQPTDPGDAILPPSTPTTPPTPEPGSAQPPAMEPVPPGTGSASVLALIREFSSAVKRAVRITGPTSIEMVDADAPLPVGWSQDDAPGLYSSTTRDLKAGRAQLSMKPEHLALLVVGAAFKTNDARILTSGWKIPDPLPVYGLSPSPVQRVSYSFSPNSFSAAVEFFVSDVPDSLRRS